MRVPILSSTASRPRHRPFFSLLPNFLFISVDCLVVHALVYTVF